MTLDARETIVTGRQQEVRFTFVVVGDGAPFENAMATTTVRTKASLVNVVWAVAGVAVAVVTILEIRTAMTGLAAKALMTADQSEPGHREVIESRFFPVRRAMTVGTLTSVSPVVYVIGLMAGYAGTPNVSKIVFLVARVASHTLVSAGKRKASEIVIEFRVAPARIAMA